MTDEEWKIVHDKLCGNREFGIAELIADGYNITLLVQPEKDLKSVIAVYINGTMRIDWVKNDCDERRKFYCQRKKMLISSQKLARMKISEKKRRAIREENTYYYYEPYWSSFNSMKRHFIKNNSNIQIKQKRENNI